MALALALQSRVCSPRLQRHLGPDEVPMNLMALLLGPEEKLGHQEQLGPLVWQ